jgi:hypothetical protein
VDDTDDEIDDYDADADAVGNGTGDDDDDDDGNGEAGGHARVNMLSANAIDSSCAIRRATPIVQPLNNQSINVTE